MRLRSTHGQATVLTVVFLTVLLGLAALVLDVGSWYRAKRDAQSTADAAALAGAQGLPDTTNAKGLAQQYAGKNVPEGQAILDNNCIAPDAVTTTTTPVSQLTTTSTESTTTTTVSGNTTVSRSGRTGSASGIVTSARLAAWTAISRPSDASAA